MKQEYFDNIVRICSYSMTSTHGAMLNMVDMLKNLAQLKEGQEFVAADLATPYQTLTEFIYRLSVFGHFSDDKMPVVIVREEPCTITHERRFWDRDSDTTVIKIWSKEVTRKVYKMNCNPAIMWEIARKVAEDCRVVF